MNQIQNFSIFVLIYSIIILVTLTTSQQFNPHGFMNNNNFHSHTLTFPPQNANLFSTMTHPDPRGHVTRVNTIEPIPSLHQPNIFTFSTGHHHPQQTHHHFMTTQNVHNVLSNHNIPTNNNFNPRDIHTQPHLIGGIQPQTPTTFQTMQFTFPNFSTPPGFGSTPPTIGTTPSIVPTTTTPHQILGSTMITATPIPTDSLSRTFQPNIFNAGSNSTELNKALKWYTDELFRIQVEKIDLANESKLLIGSPRSTQDSGLNNRFNRMKDYIDSTHQAELLNEKDQDGISMSIFQMDLKPTNNGNNNLPGLGNTTFPGLSGGNSTNSPFPKVPDVPDLPSPAIVGQMLMNPEFQNSTRNNLDLLGDLKDLFTPSHETTEFIKTVSNNGASASSALNSLANSSGGRGSSGGLPSLPRLGTSSVSSLPSLPKIQAGSIKPPSSKPGGLFGALFG